MLFLLYRAKWIKIHGTLYKKPSAIIVGMANDLPVFGEIRDILVIKEEVYFHVNIFKTLLYNEHYHSYVVILVEDHQTISYSDLLSYIPLHIRLVMGLTKYGQKAIVLKHHISTL